MNFRCAVYAHLMKQILVIACILSACELSGAESRVRMQDLPEAVQRTVKEQTKTAKLRGLTKEVENGQTFYEAETMLDGKTRDVLIDKSGAVVEVEEATSMAAVPAPVQKAFTAAAAGGKVLSVETVTKGSVTSYEATIQKGGKKSEVAVNADGTLKK
jgi:uncharacterized membrane protein YkoI